MLFWTLMLLLTLGVNSCQADDNRDLKDAVATLLTRVSGLEDSNNLLQKEVETLHDTVQTLEEENKILQESLESSETVRSFRLEEWRKSVEMNLGLLERDVGTLHDSVSALEDADEVNEAEINYLKEAFEETVARMQNEDTSFLATFDVETFAPSDPIVWNYAVLNSGGHYDTTNGIFTVPTDGAYEFNLHISSNNDIGIGAYLVVDGTLVAFTDIEDPDFPFQTVTMGLVLPLVAGQEVSVTPFLIESMFGADSLNGMWSWFSGNFIHAV